MVKKLFALASVTALTGLMVSVAGAGCSSTTTEPGAAADAATDAKKPPVEAGPEPEAGPETCPDPAAVVKAADLAALNWMAPGAVQNVCNQTDYDSLKAVFDAGKGSASFKAIKESLSPTCQACVFTPAKGGTRWGMVAETDKGAYDNRSGSCYAQLSTAECGKAIFELETCGNVVCPQDECTDQQTCIGKAVKGPCKEFATTFQAACTDQTVGDKCDDFFKTIQVSCGGGGDVDGGVDAGEDAADAASN